jgi:hypothetical protein
VKNLWKTDLFPIMRRECDGIVVDGCAKLSRSFFHRGL